MVHRSALMAYAGAGLTTLLGIGAHRLATRTTDDAAAYHTRVKAVVEALPVRVGDWAGEDVSVPSSATALLRPNALKARSYRRSTDNVVVTLVVVQCEDTRDMAGHYPPICFPANGWKALDTQLLHDMGGEGSQLPVTRYVFERASVFERSERYVFNLLLLPIQGAVNDMPDVRKAAANPQARMRGAAQIQIMLSGSVTETDQLDIVREFVRAVRPVITAVTQFEDVSELR